MLNVLTLLPDDIAQIRGNTTLLNYGNKGPILDDLLTGLHRNIPKWYHKNVIYELATIKNNIDTMSKVNALLNFQWCEADLPCHEETSCHR
jgi:hypothetical protein